MTETTPENVPSSEVKTEEPQPSPLKDLQLLVPGDTMQTILNYLAAKPFNEVAGIVELIKTTAKQVTFNDDEGKKA